jgi:MoaA/NifB/PqqE/SkfB family radical SAM enzyme
MKLPNEKFCILPWVSIETSPIGTVRPCCLAKDEITDDSNTKFQLKTASFDQIRNSSYMQKLRSQFIAGELPATCERCWAVEHSGGTSKRQHTINRLKHMVDDQEWGSDAKDLLFLDLKLGNICNLKCRICGPWSSSSYASEEVGEIMKIDRKQTYAYQMLREGRWPRESTQFWQELDLVADQIRYLEFTGGEPFMIAEHFDFLQNLVDRGLAANIEIHYNTNGTHYPERGIALWPHFKLVEIAFSIDDLGKRFEYQRTGAKWLEVHDNLYKFRHLRQQSKNIQIQLCCTISVWNVIYFPEIAAWASLFPWDFVYWNYLHDSPVWCIANIAESTKENIAYHLRGKMIVDQHVEDLEKIIAFMFSKQGWIGTGGGGTLTYEISKLDKLRQQRLQDVAPELAEIIGYQGPYEYTET